MFDDLIVRFFIIFYIYLTYDIAFTLAKSERWLLVLKVPGSSTLLSDGVGVYIYIFFVELLCVSVDSGIDFRI